MVLLESFRSNDETNSKASPTGPVFANILYQESISLYSLNGRTSKDGFDPPQTQVNRC